jgi:hypothetical protein
MYADTYLDSDLVVDDDSDDGGDNDDGDDGFSSCFSREYLADLAGTEDLAACTFLEIRADTTVESLSALGQEMPALQQLSMKNSLTRSMRTFGSTFQRLTVLWIARSGLEELAGIGSLVDLRELYAAFNEAGPDAHAISLFK